MDTGLPVTVGRSEKMSKSRRNVVDPEELLNTYGADSGRLFMMSDSPPERDLEWTESGIDGAWRYVNRIWRLIATPTGAVAAAGAARPGAMDDAGVAMTRTIHRAIAAVTGDLEHFRFNRAVAHVRELTNALEAFKAEGPGHDWVRRFGFDTTVSLIGPMMPHIAEELWQGLGHDKLLADSDWPIADAAALVDETVTIAVQVMGKLRGTIQMPRDAENAVVEQAALALEPVRRAIGNSAPRRVIIVANKIVNVVV
jgi:leucyl-tRNA synthetase